MKKHSFATEADLCAAFIAYAQRDGKWVAYPETAGWDILVVRKEDGFQIGVQAKLQFNMKVLAQCIDDYYGWREEGPDCRAVLVPSSVPGSGAICDALGLTLIEASNRDTRWYPFQPALPEIEERQWPADRCWPEWSPSRRHKLPEYVPDVAAGSPAPVRLTQWKILALRVVARIHLVGHITRTEIKAIGIDARRWVAPADGFLVPIGDGRFVPGPRMPDFEAQHPTVFPQIMAEMAEQMGGAA